MLRNKPSAAAKTSDLRRQLYNYFSSRLPQAHEETMSLSGEPTKSSVQVGTIPHIQRPSSQLPIGSPQILPNPSRQLLSKDTSMHCAHTTLKMASPTLHSPTRELTSSSEGERGYTGKENVEPDNHSQKTFFLKSSLTFQTSMTELTSGQPCAQASRPFLGRENSHGMRGIWTFRQSDNWPESMFNLIETNRLPLHFPHQKQTHLHMVSRFIWLRYQPLHYAQSLPFAF